MVVGDNNDGGAMQAVGNQAERQPGSTRVARPGARGRGGRSDTLLAGQGSNDTMPPLNEGRGVNPGDTLTEHPLGEQLGRRSTKAGV